MRTLSGMEPLATLTNSSQELTSRYVWHRHCGGSSTLCAPFSSSSKEGQRWRSQSHLTHAVCSAAASGFTYRKRKTHSQEAPLCFAMPSQECHCAFAEFLPRGRRIRVPGFPGGPTRVWPGGTVWLAGDCLWWPCGQLRGMTGSARLRSLSNQGRNILWFHGATDHTGSRYGLIGGVCPMWSIGGAGNPWLM